MSKKCSTCKRILNENEFNWKSKDIRRSQHCKSCSRLYIRNHYYKNKQYYLEKAKKRNFETRQRAHEYIGSYLKNNPCIDCDETNILVLEFDHKDRNNKRSEISRILHQRLTLDQIKSEVSKCVVRCANCHRKKTAKENNSWRLKLAPVA